MRCHAFNRGGGVIPCSLPSPICARVITGNRADHWNNFHPFLSANLPNIVKIFPRIYIYTYIRNDNTRGITAMLIWNRVLVLSRNGK